MRQSSARFITIVLGALVLGLFVILLVLLWPRLSGSANAPGPQQTPPPGGPQIVLSAPEGGATLSSPIVISGELRPRPAVGNVTVRLFGADNALLLSGDIPLQGSGDQPATFAGALPYTLAQAGPGRLELVALDPANGATLAVTSVAVNLAASQAQPGAPTATGAPLPSGPAGGAQQIVIDTPPPGSEVGSPVVITGRTLLVPQRGSLGYVVRDAAGGVLGSGEFPVVATQNGAASYTVSINFNLPPQGGAVSVEIYEPGPADAPVRAQASVPLTVAPPQAILLDTPPAGTTVGSPIVITGRTARYPFQGNLGFRVLDAGGRQLGGGTFPVSGAPGGPTSFSPSLSFNLPPQGGAIRVEVFDQNATNGQISASSSVSLQVAQQSQLIIVDTPPPGTTVGSPVVITGRAVRFPVGGQLSYRVRDAGGTQVAQGAFGVSGTPEGGATFVASITFPPPPQGGAITVDLLEIDPANNQVRASTSLPLQVAAPRPPASATPVAPASQQVIIDTPPDGTVVGSPAVLTGRVAIWPFEATLGYQVRTAAGELIGQGGITVAGEPGQFNLPWVASLSFTEPAQGGEITILVFDEDAATGGVRASDTVRLRVNPRQQPLTPTIPSGNAGDGGQQIFIDTPAPDSLVGSPVTITGRVARYPADGNLDYRVLTLDRRELASGFFPVGQGPGGVLPWTASLTFLAPQEGGAILVELFDRNDATGATQASVFLQLRLATP